MSSEFVKKITKIFASLQRRLSASLRRRLSASLRRRMKMPQDKTWHMAKYPFLRHFAPTRCHNKAISARPMKRLSAAFEQVLLGNTSPNGRRHKSARNDALLALLNNSDLTIWHIACVPVAQNHLKLRTVSGLFWVHAFCSYKASVAGNMPYCQNA